MEENLIKWGEEWEKCDRLSDRSLMMDPLSYILFNWYNKVCGMYYPVCAYKISLSAIMNWPQWFHTIFRMPYIAINKMF